MDVESSGAGVVGIPQALQADQAVWGSRIPQQGVGAQARRQQKNERKFNHHRADAIRATLDG
jgi:hypothetical protein